jgi:hypothetical protein
MWIIIENSFTYKHNVPDSGGSHAYLRPRRPCYGLRRGRREEAIAAPAQALTLAKGTPLKLALSGQSSEEDIMLIRGHTFTCHRPSGRLGRFKFFLRTT